MKKLVICLVLGVWCLGFADRAVAASITKQSSAEFSASGAAFSNTRASAEGVALKFTGRIRWADGGVTVSNPALTFEADAVDMAGDGRGGAYLSWRNRATGSSVYNPVLGRIDIDGNVYWRTGEVSPLAIASTEALRIATSINGSAVDGVIAVFQNSSENISAVKLNPEREQVWVASACSASGVQDRPQVISDGAGGAVVTWKDYRSNPSAPAIFAQRLTSTGGVAAGWVTNGVTVCASTSGLDKASPRIVSVGSEGYIVSWIDDDGRSNYLRARRITTNGLVEIPQWGSDLQTGAKVTDRTGTKGDRMMATIGAPYSGAVFVWVEGDEPSRDIRAQWMSPDATRNWGNNGVSLPLAPGTNFSPCLASLPSAETFFGWLGSVTTYEGFVQKLNAAGVPVFGSGGKGIGASAPLSMISDEAGGVYMAGIGVSPVTLAPLAQRISSSGEELWETDGIPLGTSAIDAYSGVPVYPPMAVVPSPPNGAVFAWVDSRTGKKAVYAQRVVTGYPSGGTYTTEKINNSDVAFVSWGNITWEATGTITAEVKTAASSTALDSAAWAPATSGGSISSNGQYLQARFYAASDALGQTTPVLRSVSFNYSTDTSYPSVEASVRGEKLSTSDRNWVTATPTIDAVLTDDKKLSSADIKVDDASVGYSTLSSTDTRWEIRAPVTTALLPGDHSLKIEVIDDAGNKTTAAYTLAVAVRSEVEGSTAAFAEGSKIIINYTLTADTTVTVEIRNLFTGELIKKAASTSGTTGGSAGGNTVSIEAGDLGKGVYGYTIYPSGGAPVTGKFAIQ